MEAIAPKFEIKIHEDKDMKDYVFMIPSDCPSAQAKMILMAMYEHIVSFEMVRRAEAEMQKEKEAPKVEAEVKV